MKANLLEPYENYTGNLLWGSNGKKLQDEKIKQSLDNLRARGYWASSYPEGDGVTFTRTEAKEADLLTDFQACFPYLCVCLTPRNNSTGAYIELIDDKETIDCTVLVPLHDEIIYDSFEFEGISFVCSKEMDLKKWERVSDFSHAYLQTSVMLKHKDILLRESNSQAMKRLGLACLKKARSVISSMNSKKIKIEGFDRKFDRIVDLHHVIEVQPKDHRVKDFLIKLEIEI